MANGFSITGKMDGLEDVLKTLAGLPDKLQRKIMRPALSKATKGTVTAARRFVRKDSGALKKSIGRKVVTIKSNGTLIVIIGPRRGYAIMVTRSGRSTPQKENPVNIAHLVEFGTRPHAISKGARLGRKGKEAIGQASKRLHPGTQARPFLRPAFDATKGEIERIFAEEVAAGLARELAKG